MRGQPEDVPEFLACGHSDRAIANAAANRARFSILGARAIPVEASIATLHITCLRQNVAEIAVDFLMRHSDPQSSVNLLDGNTVYFDSLARGPYGRQQRDSLRQNMAEIAGVGDIAAS